MKNNNLFNQKVLKKWDSLQERLGNELKSQKKRDYREIYNTVYSYLANRTGSKQPYGRLVLLRSSLLSRVGFHFPDFFSVLRLLQKSIYVTNVGGKKKILEVGGEDGLLSVALSKKGADVYCTDISDLALKETSENAQKFSSNTIKLKLMDGRKIDFPENQFDIIIGVDFLEHLHQADILDHTEEAYRALKRGGYYLISTPSGLYYRPGGLHLKIYTFKDISEILPEGFLLNAPLLNFAPLFLFSESIFKFKKKVESFFAKYKIPKIIGQLAGIDPIIILAKKK